MMIDRGEQDSKIRRDASNVAPTLRYKAEFSSSFAFCSSVGRLGSAVSYACAFRMYSVPSTMDTDVYTRLFPYVVIKRYS